MASILLPGVMFIIASGNPLPSALSDSPDYQTFFKDVKGLWSILLLMALAKDSSLAMYKKRFTVHSPSMLINVDMEIEPLFYC